MIRQCFPFLLWCLLLQIAHINVFSQTQIIKAGKIHFEKKISLHREIAGTEMENFRNSIPQFHNSYFSLSFTEKMSLYELEKAAPPNSILPDEKSEADVFRMDLSSGLFERQANLQTDVSLVKDSLPKILWKIRSETRDIAGFDCVRAEAIVYDSIYVIAFFSPQLQVSGGPLQLHGLPGMILGLVVPRLNLSLFATSFELISPDEQVMKQKQVSGKKISLAGYEKKVQILYRQTKGNLRIGYLRQLL
ncbi:GLPGLI family protein [Sediminibacterium roseum]|uniref:GLPGLI family protein n=1 Tax=Sediminibacterium roseum TaxID=1978412 RepID=A0ABW9ZTA0_9BACT|nr:GLPGLI family protein [Sediminibacterium roseum]NCI50214.1 GLPGLI family protein [Sediminibacterium roseum]